MPQLTLNWESILKKKKKKWCSNLLYKRSSTAVIFNVGFIIFWWSAGEWCVTWFTFGRSLFLFTGPKWPSLQVEHLIRIPESQLSDLPLFLCGCKRHVDPTCSDKHIWVCFCLCHCSWFSQCVLLPWQYKWYCSQKYKILKCISKMQRHKK